jgi:hypothetical protein
MPPAILQSPARWWRAFLALPRRSRIRWLLLGALIFMLAGHAAVMMSGAVFDPRSGEWYHPARRWVSDFAAKWPEGVLIKISIAFFCAALADFFCGIIRWRCSPGFSLQKCWWLLVGAAMVMGLLLVAVFDMSPAQYEYHRPNWLFRIFGKDGRFVELSRSRAEWIMRAQHQFGFRLFVAGFFAAAFTLAFIEYHRGVTRRLVWMAALLLLASGFAAWLIASRTVWPGIPQRALLVIMFVWLLRECRAFGQVLYSKQSVNSRRL